MAMNACHHYEFTLCNSSRRSQYDQIGRNRNGNTDSFDKQEHKDGSQTVLYQEEIKAVHVDASIHSFILCCIKLRKNAMVGLLCSEGYFQFI